MAAILDIPLKIGGVIIKILYEAPIPLLVLGFFTLILTGIAFVSAAQPIVPYPMLHHPRLLLGLGLTILALCRTLCNCAHTSTCPPIREALHYHHT